MSTQLGPMWEAWAALAVRCECGGRCFPDLPEVVRGPLVDGLIVFLGRPGLRLCRCACCAERLAQFSVALDTALAMSGGGGTR